MIDPSLSTKPIARHSLSALRISLLYLVVGCLWILFSDYIVASLSSSIEMLAWLSTIKGWFYILTTALLLYWLIQRESSELRQREESLRLALDATRDAIWDWNVRSGQMYYSQAYFTMLGYPADAFQGDYQAWLDLVHPDDREKLLQVNQGCIDNEYDSFEIEYRMRDAGGEWRWVLDRGKGNNRGKDGRAGRLLGTHMDITDRKRSEQALRQREELLRLVGKMAKVGGWEFDSRTLQGTWTEEVARIHGLDPDQETNVQIGTSYYQAESRAAIEAAIQAAIHHGQPYDLELEMVLPDGRTKWVRTIGQPVKEGDQVYKVQGSFQDITERKQAEDLLLYQANLLQNVTDAVISTDLGYNINSWNRAAEAMYGWSAGEVLGRPAGQVLQTVYEGLSSDEVRRLALEVGTWKGEVVQKCKDGASIDVLASVSQVKDRAGKLVGYVTVNRDITESKRIAEALRTSERNLKLFVEYAPAAIAMMDCELKYIAVSRRYLQDYRIEREDVLGRSHYEIFPEVPQRWKEIHQRCLSGEVEKCDEDPFPRSDGTIDWVRWEIHPWYEKSGDIGGIILFSELVSERKYAKMALSESEQRFRQLADSMPQLVWTAQPDGVVDYYNQRYLEYGGIQPLENQSWEWGPALHPEDRGPTEVAWQQAVNSGHVFQMEHRVQMADGTYRWHLSRGVPVRDADGKVSKWFGTATDIQDTKLVEAALRQNEELLRLAYDAGDIGVWRHRKEEAYIQLNARAQAHYGFDYDAPAAADLLARVHPDDVQHFKDVLAESVGEQGSGRYAVEFRVIHPDQSIHWLDVHAR
ncbi:MAG: PAS domain S-box protein, partial [Chloroflexi bacterium]|nr:PAS domain S-box protein [Chloroflexota bacterium]